MISPQQKPLGSGFGPEATAADVIGSANLSGKVAIVTGGYSGLGTETVRVLAEAGATVVVPARNMDKAKAALAGTKGVEIDAMDLAEPESVAAFAKRFLASGRPLSILVNSAGIMATPMGRDGEGHELQFATNHLGHFRLTLALWPALAAAKGARVVSVSSRGHQFAGVDFDDIGFTRRPYDKWVAYGQAKSANALFAVALDRRGKGEQIRAFSLHPGSILTDLGRHLERSELEAFGLFTEDGKPRIDPARDKKTVEQGAATSVWCATSPQLDGLGGVYCEDSDIAPVRDAGKSGLGRGVHPWAADSDIAERLWRLSEQMTRVTLS